MPSARMSCRRPQLRHLEIDFTDHNNTFLELQTEQPAKMRSKLRTFAVLVALYVSYYGLLYFKTCRGNISCCPYKILLSMSNWSTDHLPIACHIHCCPRSNHHCNRHPYHHRYTPFILRLFLDRWCLSSG